MHEHSSHLPPPPSLPPSHTLPLGLTSQDFEQRLRHYFVDSSMTPLLVHENFLQTNVSMPNNIPPKSHAAYALHRAMHAADFVASSDVVGTRILKDQQWGLAPLHGALSCIAPGHYMRGNLGRVQFPQFLGRTSTTNKRARLLREATCRMASTISGSKTEVRGSYIPALRPYLLQPLLHSGADGIETTIERLDAYGLSKDDFDSVMEFEVRCLPPSLASHIFDSLASYILPPPPLPSQLLVGANAKPAMSALSTAVKSSLTRKYNQAPS